MKLYIQLEAFDAEEDVVGQWLETQGRVTSMSDLGDGRWKMIVLCDSAKLSLEKPPALVKYLSKPLQVKPRRKITLED